MSLADLLPKNLPFNRESPQAEYYFAINIAPKEVIGSVWGIEGKTLKIISSARASYEGQEELAQSCNRALDEALGDFQPEPTKILFGVPDSWLLDENLKDEYLNLLKHLVKELDVEPMAYVSSTHAICHLLQKQTGVPSTTILVNLTDPLVVTVVKAGKILGTKSVKRTEDLPQDIERVLIGFTGVEVLPSKISLYGGTSEGMEKFKDELTGFNWMSNLPFLHLPKVEVLEEEIGIKAVSLAGASEIEPEVVYTSEKLPVGEKKPLVSHDLVEPEEHQAKGVMEKAGFVSGDITQMDHPLEDEEVEQLSEEPLPSRELDRYQPYPRKESVPLDGVVGKLTGLLTSFNLSVRLPFLKKLPSGKKEGLDKKFIVLPILILLVLVGAYIFLPKAKVTIYIDPHVLEKDAQVIADPSVTSVDNADSKIPGKIVTTDVSGADKGTATGTKQVGDPAKGTVNVYNLTNNPVSISQGTVLTGSNGLKFTLDSSVQVASESAVTGADLTTTTTPGKTSSGATASAIGPDSNLSADTTLTVAGYSQSQVVAKVDSNGLTGGTSQNVTVVTSDDQKRLLASLASQLRQKAQQQIQAQLSGDEKILPEALDEQITKTVYSKDIGDQASDFTLNLTIHYKGTAYSDTDLKTMVGKLVETNVPDGFMLNLADTQTQADVSKLNKDGTLVFLAKFKANLIPKIDTDSIQKQIEGKTPEQAASIIQGVQNVIGSDISITPTIPGPLERLPFLGDHISFDVTTK